MEVGTQGRRDVALLLSVHVNISLLALPWCMFHGRTAMAGANDAFVDAPPWLVIALFVRCHQGAVGYYIILKNQDMLNICEPSCKLFSMISI